MSQENLPSGSNASSRLSPPKIEIVDTGTRLGRGVYATADFSKGDIVEYAPVLLLGEYFDDLPVGIRRRVFNWTALTGSGIRHALAMGYGSFYNHSDSPNLVYTAHPEAMCLHYTAQRDIKAGEQLTIDYNQVLEGQTPRETDWFEGNNVEKVSVEDV